jgi:transposase
MMIGQKDRIFRQHASISLDELVPEDNFYRQLEECINLEFIRDLVQDLYSNIGRPSIDPIVFFKLQLIAFFEGIRSERQLMEMVNLNLAHRWFIGYDLGEAVPDHSSLSKIRERYGFAVFQDFFEKIVELCKEAGLIWGEELYLDSTKVQANASINGMVDRSKFETQDHLEALFDENSDTGMIAKYNGERLASHRNSTYQRITDKQVSPVDPDASPMRQSGGGKAVLGYHDHYVVDGGKARIILRALVTPASIMDNTPMLDLVEWVKSRWQIDPKIAVGDAKYGTVKNIVGLENAKIKAYMPIPDLSRRTGLYTADDFQYDAELDQYICPQGIVLPLRSRRKNEQMYMYRADTKICNACPAKIECTKSKSGRHIFRSFHQEYVERVKEYHQTEHYQKSMRKRGYWVEPLFGEAKDFHRLRRFRLRGLMKVNIEGVMIAAGQNLKRLIKHALDNFCSYFKRAIISECNQENFDFFNGLYPFVTIPK